MKQRKYIPGILLLIMLSLGFSSCYVGYYEPAPRRPYYNRGHHHRHYPSAHHRNHYYHQGGSPRWHR